MSTRTIKLEDFSSEIGKYANLSAKKKQQAIARGIAKSIPDLVANSPVDTGRYAASWTFTMEEGRAIIGNHAPYAGVIEYGTRPFTPPIGPLLAWAKRVLSGDHSVETGQPETNYSPEVWALAKAVQHKISKYGMEPKHVMERTIPKIVENIKQELKNAARE